MTITLLKKGMCFCVSPYASCIFTGSSGKIDDHVFGQFVQDLWAK